MIKKFQTLRYITLLVTLIQFNAINSQIPIEWQNKIGCISSGSAILKTVIGNNYNAGASSANTLQSGQDGWVEFTITQEAQKLAFGLSQVDNGTGLNSIEYAFETNINNKLKIYTNGTLLGAFGSYKVGDKLRIQRKANSLTFYNNSSLLKTIPLLYNTNSFIVDVSLATESSSIKALASFIKPLTINPIITDVNSTTGVLGSVDLNISGGKPPYSISWTSPYLNHETFPSNQFISDLEIGTYTSKITDESGASIVQIFTIYNKIDWIDSIGVVVTDSSLIKTTGLDSWIDAGAYSQQELKANESGFLIHKITSLKSKYAIGLHNTALGKIGYHYNTMEYSFVISNKKLLIYKRNKLQLRLATDLVVGDELRIQKVNGDISLYHNSIKLFSQVLTIPIGVSAQVSLFKANSELKQIKTTFVRPLHIFYTQQDVNCIKERLGEVTVNPIGGVPPYQYSFNNAAFVNTNFFKGLINGNYTINVKDRTNREAKALITILNCPIWANNPTELSINSQGDVVKNGGGDTWDGTPLVTAEPFAFKETPSWISFKTPDTLSVFILGFRSIEFDETAQTTNYKLMIENSIATILETDNDGFYNKRELVKVTKDMGFKLQLTTNGIEYYVRTNDTAAYELLYVSKLFSNATMIIENQLYKTGSKVNAIRVSEYGNTIIPTPEN
jgi:hypothetical protein